jgi:hypothetical protein
MSRREYHARCLGLSALIWLLPSASSILMLRELITIGKPGINDPYARRAGQIEELYGWTLVYDSLASAE